MTITWITFGPINYFGNQYSSPLASARYRIIIPAIELTKHSHVIKIVPVLDGTSLHDLLPHLTADAIIFSKSFSGLNEELAKCAQQAGTRIFFDVCDNNFEHPKYANYYRSMIALADKVIANTPQMAEVISHYTGKAAAVISDPYEGVRGLSHFSPLSSHLRLLWFGHPVNFDSLQAMLPQVLPLARQVPLELHIVTASQMGIEPACLQFNQQYGQQFRLRFSPWSLATTWQALQETDIVVIPTVVDNRKLVKSPNRLIESLWAGRFVVAQPLPAYQEFAAWAWVDGDMIAGLQWALQHPEEVKRRIVEAQQYIAVHFSPAVIAQQWEVVLGTS